MPATTKKILSLTCFAAIFLTGVADRASAATVSASQDDVILSFQVTDPNGPDASSDLEIDLGSVAQFYQPTPGVIALAGMQVADLIDTFGANWNLRTDLFWSVMATTGTVQGTTVTVSGVGNSIARETMWASEAETTPGTQAPTPWHREGGSAQGSGLIKINNLYATTQPGGVGGLNGAVSTANSSVSAVLSSTNPQTNGITQEAGPNGTFGYFTSGGSTQNTTNIPTGTLVASDFYELQPDSAFPQVPGTLVGGFALTSAGVFEFSSNIENFASAITIPEPASTAAIFGLIALAGIWLRRPARRPKPVYPDATR